MMASRTLAVSLQNERVGLLEPDPKAHLRFRFDPRWTSLSGIMRRVFSQAEGRQGGIWEPDPSDKARSIPTFFQNLLPEGPARKSASVMLGAQSDAELLMALGDDLFGGVTISSGDSTLVLERAPFRLGLSGAQRKIVAPGSRMGTAFEGVDAILKIPTGRWTRDLVANEHAMLLLCSEAGFPTARATRLSTSRTILSEEASQIGPEILAVKRFDRLADGLLIHAEDLCQAMGMSPKAKYDVSHEEVAAFLVEVGIPFSEVVRRIALNALTGNGDGHAKNFALLYTDGSIPKLSPVYDQVATIYYFGGGGLALSLCGRTEWAQVDLEAFRDLARSLGQSEEDAVEAVEETHDAIMSAWPRVRREAPVDLASALEDFWECELALTSCDFARPGVPGRSGFG